MVGLQSDLSGLFVGKKFDNYKDFLCAFNEFCADHYEPLMITTNNTQHVTVHCRHGYKSESNSTGK